MCYTLIYCLRDNTRNENDQVRQFPEPRKTYKDLKSIHPTYQYIVLHIWTIANLLSINYVWYSVKSLLGPE